MGMVACMTDPFRVFYYLRVERENSYICLFSIPSFFLLPVPISFRNSMPARILVAYVSPKGSTAGIAEAIGRELQSAGYRVDVIELKSVRSLAEYRAVVIGGPFYMGKIAGDITQFVGKYRETLIKMPVAVFAVGVAPVNATPADIEKARAILHKSVEPIVPVAEALFSGKIDPDKLSFIQKRMVSMVKAPVGDFRDWDAIASWARDLPARFGI